MAECHPILFLRLLDRRRASGARLIVVDPRRRATAEKADLYLPIEPGTDLALLNPFTESQWKWMETHIASLEKKVPRELRHPGQSRRSG